MHIFKLLIITFLTICLKGIAFQEVNLKNISEEIVFLDKETKTFFSSITSKSNYFKTLQKDIFQNTEMSSNEFYKNLFKSSIEPLLFQKELSKIMNSSGIAYIKNYEKKINRQIDDYMWGRKDINKQEGNEKYKIGEEEFRSPNEISFTKILPNGNKIIRYEKLEKKFEDGKEVTETKAGVKYEW